MSILFYIFLEFIVLQSFYEDSTNTIFPPFILFSWRVQTRYSDLLFSMSCFLGPSHDHRLSSQNLRDASTHHMWGWVSSQVWLLTVLSSLASSVVPKNLKWVVKREKARTAVRDAHLAESLPHGCRAVLGSQNKHHNGTFRSHTHTVFIHTHTHTVCKMGSVFTDSDKKVLFTAFFLQIYTYGFFLISLLSFKSRKLLL